jgi:alkyl sulfatase BDS1-like metallo-beta-lactamase superfamily hydrolase
MKASFDPSGSQTGPAGQRAHSQHLQHSERLRETLYEVTDKAWSYVGNGLSNQSFIEGPEGLIAIDTGESIEEMQKAIEVIRTKTQAPIVACIYTHFHYVSGTKAIIEEAGFSGLPIYGHAGIAANLERFGGEVGPRGSRGMVHQFGISMPDEGADGLVNIGLGRFFRNPDHAPFSAGYLPATVTFDTPFKTRIAGLEVEFYPAPSDATDSVSIWFPALDLAVNNLLWPAFFNIFAIRGEEYRDPRILLQGLDQLFGFNAEHQIATHGPPISGRDHVSATISRYRDAIQFVFDQTVRGANRGLSLDQLIAEVSLPELFDSDFHTQQLYGLVEHHIRQVYTGLFGWFDEDESKLFPTPQPEKAVKMIAAFGGIAASRQLCDQALDQKDYRWSIEVASQLVKSQANAPGEDRSRLALGLKGIAYSTPSANARNWCLTRALELEGQLDLSRFRVHRFREREILNSRAGQWVSVLKVLLDPGRAAGKQGSLGFEFSDGSSAGLIIRNQVAVPCELDQCDTVIKADHANWAKLLGGKMNLSEFLETSNGLTVEDKSIASELLACFDLPGFLL